MTRLLIEMLPAAQGDGLWVEWTHAGRPCRVLIDGGPGKTYPALRQRVLSMPRGDTRLDVVTITHVDTDHIDGVVTLLLDDLGLDVGDIWFNGRNHAQNPLSPVAGNRYLGGVQGQVLSAILALPRFRWNEAFAGRAIVVDPVKRAFPTAVVGGLTFTVLSPRVKQLERLATAWDADIVKALAKLELIPEGVSDIDVSDQITRGGFDLARELLQSRYPKRVAPPPEWDVVSEESAYLGDNSIPNGSSIAFLVEDPARNIAVLFAGDAHAAVLYESIVELLVLRGDRRLRLDAFKLSHHGSQHNTTSDLLAKLDCDTFLVSSDGSGGYNHPDDETIELIIAEGRKRGVRPQLYFNYESHRTRHWSSSTRGNGGTYDAHYPRDGGAQSGLILTIGQHDEDPR